MPWTEEHHYVRDTMLILELAIIPPMNSSTGSVSGSPDDPLEHRVPQHPPP
jgi:hypothetical protein